MLNNNTILHITLALTTEWTSSEVQHMNNFYKDICNEIIQRDSKYFDGKKELSVFKIVKEGMPYMG